MTNAPATSRILTLVFTDLAGSTALKSEHGDHTAGALIDRHRAVVETLAGETSGRIVSWAGDGCFLTFDAPSAAVTFALMLQSAHAEARDLPSVRVGMHMGEVGEMPGVDPAHPRIEGLAVDLAARICDLARPAQVLVSAAVHGASRQRIDAAGIKGTFRWQKHGAFELKGLGEPLDIHEVGVEEIASFQRPNGGAKSKPARGPALADRRTGPAIAVSLGLVAALTATVAFYALRRAPDTASPRPATGVAATAASVPEFGGRPAIAVLPFENLSPDPEQAIFADGLAEDLITRLASWRAFPVIARTSSFRYRGRDLDVRQVGAELGARYLVEGSVQRAGDRIRIAAQLIDAESAEHVWAESFDREIANVFALQDEIGATIAASLVGDLTHAEGERARQKGTESLQAWSYYQLGLQHTYRYTEKDSAEAMRYYERALELDPRFATALARLALENWTAITGHGHAPTPEDSARAIATARRAVELDPREPTAYLALGGAYIVAGDAANAIDAVRQAVDLNPSMPEAWIWLGWAQLLGGSPQDCVTATNQALALNPRGPSVWIHDSLGMAQWELGLYDEALASARRLIAAHPTYLTGYPLIALASAGLGDLEQAREAIAEGRRIRPDLSIAMLQNYLAVERPEVDARRNAVLLQAGLE